jgi:hypothetical protein
MELLDRYLQSVKFWLPRAQQQDILAELSEDLRSEIEEKERAAGRKLTEAEVEAVLKQRGSPYRVASHYLPQRYLIGPAFFPLYATLLKGITFFYLVPWLAAWIFMVAFLPRYRAEHPGWQVLGTLAGLWTVALYAFAGATIVIALMERSARGGGFVDSWERKWNPPSPIEAYRIRRGDAIGQFLGGLVFSLWWLGLIHRPQIEGLRIDFAPQVYQLVYWPIIAVVLAGSALAAVNLFRPHWTRGRLLTRIVIRGLEGLTTAAFLAVSVPVVVEVVGATAAQQALLTHAAVWTVRVTAAAIGLYALGDGARALWLLAHGRYLTAGAPGAGPAAEAHVI